MQKKRQKLLKNHPKVNFFASTYVLFLLAFTAKIAGTFFSIMDCLSCHSRTNSIYNVLTNVWFGGDRFFYFVASLQVAQCFVFSDADMYTFFPLKKCKINDEHQSKYLQKSCNLAAVFAYSVGIVLFFLLRSGFFMIVMALDPEVSACRNP